MSNFPTPNSYRTPISESHLAKIKPHGFLVDVRFVLKRGKGAYLYDIDGNKYVDFYLDNGAVILGHSNPTLTKFIKNGLSAGVSSIFPNKFHHRLINQFKSFIEFDTLSMFSSQSTMFLSLINSIKPATIGVNTDYLLNFLQHLFPTMSVETAQPEQTYDLLMLEPIDFDNNLETVDSDNYKAKLKVGFEGRSGFRVRQGFMFDLNKMDAIMTGSNLANGLECGVILCSDKFRIDGENISIYQSVAINETLKLYRRKLIPFSISLKLPEGVNGISRGTIFKLNNEVHRDELLAKGIYLPYSIGFISAAHTEHDLRRMAKALSG